MMIGMDFGTTNSGMAVYNGRDLRLIPLDPANQNATVARTALYITNDMQITIGRQAIDTYYDQNLNRPVRLERVTVGEITMLFAELPPLTIDVTIDKDVFEPGRLFLSFKTSLSSKNFVGTVIGSQFYFLEDIIALYLYIAKRRAEVFLGTDLRQVVLGRPVHFSLNPEEDQLAQERLLKAAFKAGYDEVVLQYEPIAAAYHYESTLDREQNVLIFDFGGGTLDISILRLGNPKTRQVLATGGVPIAGDHFDQKITRAKLPHHFGEGTTYRSGDKELPVPSNFFEAFSNWQELLTLQRPETLEKLEWMKLSCQSPLKIRRLINLISTNYGLKVYDIVESTKRELSNAQRSVITLKHPDFYVREPITRTDLERIIRHEIKTIETHLDAVIKEAGLHPDTIDAVIRTGGSSQIPAFVQILETRFGADKVHSLDTFASVTSGLGIIAHQIETGQIDARVHRREDYTQVDTAGNTRGVQSIEFEVLKKFVTVTESQHDAPPERSVMALTDEQETIATIYQPDACQTDQGGFPLNMLGLQPGQYGWVIDATSDEPVLLMTTDYRFLLKTPRQLAELNAMGLKLTDTESFQADAFGKEYVYAAPRWRTIRDDSPIALITTAGYARIFRPETLIPRIEQPIHYHTERMKGYPLMLLNIGQRGELILISKAGRAARLPAEQVLQSEARVMRVPPKDRLVAAFYVEQHTPLVIMTANGYGRRMLSASIPSAKELNTPGQSIIARNGIIGGTLLRNEQPLWAVTSERVLPLDINQLPQEDADSRTSQQALRLHKEEILVSLITPGM